jgi:hypothetical protein
MNKKVVPKENAAKTSRAENRLVKSS